MNVIFAVTKFMKPIYDNLADFLGQGDNVGTLPKIENTRNGKKVSEADKKVLEDLIEGQYNKIRGKFIHL